MIITIDGPAASGKSTIARALARRLGYYYICSGLLYRALGYLLISECGYTIENVNELKQIDVDHCFDPKKFSYCYDEEKGEHIFFDTHDITPYLKEKSMDQIASIISVNKIVRQAVTQLQYMIASEYNIVIDGRDVGSLIFPHAEYKFFITASLQVRAKRWQKDQEKYGNYFSLQDATVRIADRDERDKNRAVAPLIIPEGAIIIDTSDITIDQVITTILNYIHA